MRRTIINFIPDIEPDELLFIESLAEGLSEDNLDSFCMMYRSKRKKPETILIMSIIGFIGAAGIHRIFLNQVLLGIIYLFTGGLCLIGTIIDTINHKQLAQDFNEKLAIDIITHFRHI